MKSPQSVRRFCRVAGRGHRRRQVGRRKNGHSLPPSQKRRGQERRTDGRTRTAMGSERTAESVGRIYYSFRFQPTQSRSKPNDVMWVTRSPHRPFLSTPSRFRCNDSVVSPHYLLLRLDFYCLFLRRWPWIGVEAKEIFVFPIGEREREGESCERVRVV